MAYALIAITSAAHAETTVGHHQFFHEKRVMTVGGALAVRANKKDGLATDVYLKDKVLTTIASDSVSFDFKFTVRGSDVVLFHAAEGVSCPAMYYFLLVGADGKSVFSGKDGFGNCDDMPILRYDDRNVTLSVSAGRAGRPSTAKQIERWVWDYSTKSPVKQK